MSHQVVIKLDGVQFVPGFRFGFAQPCLLAKLSIIDHTHVSAALVGRFATEVRQLLPNTKDDAGSWQNGRPYARLVATLAAMTCTMQDSVGLPVVGAGKVFPMGGKIALRAEGRAESSIVALPSFSPKAAELALRALLRLWSVYSQSAPEQRLSEAERALFDKTLDQISELGIKGTNQHRLLRAALRRKIPMISLPGGVWQLGWGHRARLFKSSISDATSAIGTAWAKDKVQTHLLLKAAGLPVPEQVVVRDVDAALKEAKRIGYPVVLKPADLDQGTGVESGLADEAQLIAAFARVSAHKRRVLLEQHVEGFDLRTNVVNGRFQNAAMRYPAGVTGDGALSVAQLVAQVNTDPRRSTRRFSVMRPIVVNDEALELLKLQGMSEASVPEAGCFVRLRHAANITSGGHTRGVSEEFHEDNIRLCERAAKILRVDIAGIDFLTPDYRASWIEVGGVICEVNAQAQIGLSYPEIYPYLLENFVEDQGRIPIGLVVTDDPKSAQSIGEALHAAYPYNKLRIVLDGELRGRVGNLGHGFNVRSALIDPETTSLVIITSGESIEREGLPLDHVDQLWLADWNGAHTQLLQRLRSILPHMAPGEIFTDNKHLGLLEGQKLPQPSRFVFGDQITITLAVGERLAGLSEGAAAC